MRIENLSYINCIRNQVIKKEALASFVEKLVFHFSILFIHSSSQLRTNNRKNILNMNFHLEKQNKKYKLIV